LTHSQLRPCPRVVLIQDFEAAVGDASGALRATWLNQPFLRDVRHRPARGVYGMVEMRGMAVCN
jgi:hypothetical protein